MRTANKYRHMSKVRGSSSTGRAATGRGTSVMLTSVAPKFDTLTRATKELMELATSQATVHSLSRTYTKQVESIRWSGENDSPRM